MNTKRTKKRRIFSETEELVSKSMKEPAFHEADSKRGKRERRVNQKAIKEEDPEDCAIKEEVEYEFDASSTFDECDPLAISYNSSNERQTSPVDTTIRIESTESLATNCAVEEPLCQPSVNNPGKETREDGALQTSTNEDDDTVDLCSIPDSPDVISCSSEDEEPVIHADFLRYPVAEPCLTPLEKSLGPTVGATPSGTAPIAIPSAVSPNGVRTTSTTDQPSGEILFREQPSLQHPVRGTNESSTTYSSRVSESAIQHHGTFHDSDVILLSSDDEEPIIQADSSIYPIGTNPCVNLLNKPHCVVENVSSLDTAPALVKTESDTLDPPHTLPGYFWTSEELPNHSIPFTGKPGLKQRPNGSAPYDFFRLVVNREFYSIFMSQANACANEMEKEKIGASKKKYIKTLICQWKPMSFEQELDLWLAILIQMGGIQCPSLIDYWSAELMHQSTFFTKVSHLMSKDRWLGIMQVLHFLKTSGGSIEPFFKISPLIKWFNKRMKELYEPEKELCLGEPMVLRQGRLVPWRCVEDKKRGTKLHSLTEPGELFLRFFADKIDLYDESASSKVVETLLIDFMNKGHSVFMANCYNSVDLSHKLLSLGLHTCGPLLTLRKGIPEQIVHSNPERGHVVFTRSNHGVVVMKWRDDYDQVVFISSELSPQLVETTYKSDKKLKPEAVAAFDKRISRFSKPFHDLSEYGAVHKHATNHVKIGVHIIQMAIYNAFVLYKKFTGSNLDFGGFRTELVRGLCNFKREIVKKPLTEKQPSMRWHRLELLGKEERSKRCCQCIKDKRKTAVSTVCVVCPKQPALCLGQCFVQWHCSMGLKNVI